MKNSFLQTLRDGFEKVGNIFKGDNAKDPLMIQSYRGYANAHTIFLKGRVLENEGIFVGKSDHEIRNLLESFKRFETDEIPGAKVRIKIYNQQFEVITDREGYFTLDVDWTPPLNHKSRWITANIELVETPELANPSVTATGEIYYAAENASFGVVTDIDDTVLQTHVTSLFKLKMVYATLFQDSHQRLPMEGVVDLFQAFVRGGDGKRENPIFYVSNSPWNIYDLLADFMEHHHLPKGPILLRDYGLKPSEDFGGHKLNTIRRILDNHPNLPFILLGDTAAEDADFYITLADEFPGRIAAIYIRQTKDTKNARRIARLVEANTHIDVVLTNSSKGMVNHARAKGYLV